MQSFREQSNYHGSQQTYPPEAHGPSRIEEYSPRQQAQMFQGSYGGRRGAAGTPTTVTPGDNASLQNYQAYRKDSGDFFYLGNKEGSAPGTHTPQRRSSGPVQNYGPAQGTNSSGSTGFGSHYGREGHHSQFSGQHSATANISQYSQDFPGSFSPSGGQYPSHVPAQQLRPQVYQAHHPISQSANASASAGASHLQQMQRSAAISSSVAYPLRMGQYGQHYQSSAGSSTSYAQRFGQTGASYEGYSPGDTSTAYESHISGSSYGTQQGFSSYSQHLKNFESTKIAQGGDQGQQQQNPHVMQFSNSSKLTAQNQAGQFNQSEVPVQSPMQFQQNFSPISNPSPAASVVQSPSCSSTPSPLMTSGENLQCSQASVQHPSRNRIMPMMPQLSPNTPIGTYKGFGVEGQTDKHLTDPGLSSLNALSSQVANLPNTVQHMLLSDALAPNKKGSKRTSRKTDSCANSETSSQAEEQLKSPMTESLDGSCSNSSGDPGERVRQFSGQSTSSEAGYKGPPSEKPASPVQDWQTEPPEKTTDQDPDTVPEPAESFQEVPKPSEKSVGVIVSMETMTNRLEKVVDEVPKPADDLLVESNFPKTEENDHNCSNNQNGESSAFDSVSASAANISQTESVRSSVNTGFGTKEAPTSTKYSNNLPSNNKISDLGNVGAQGDKKAGRNEKFPSLLQEVLQGHHQQEGRYARSTQELPAGMGNSEVVLRSNILTNQANEQSNRNILGKNTAPHLEAPNWSQWERKSSLEAKLLNLDFTTARKFEAEVTPSSHELNSGPSERRSVICDISPLRQIVREPTASHIHGTAQERPPDGRPGQSVILPSGMLVMEKSNCLGGIPKVDDVETPKIHRKRTGEHCMPYGTKDSVRGSASPRSMTYDPNQDYSSHNSRTLNTKRGTGRVGPRGRSPAPTQDLGEKLMSPGRRRGPTEIPRINPTVSLSERTSREALYSAFFQNTDSSTLGYHTNSRASSYGDPHTAFTSHLHYKRQMYQQEDYKEWLGSSAQAMLSASQHRQEMQRKSPRQEPFHVRSPGKSENEGLGYSQSSSYHEPSNIDYSRQLRMNEGTSSNMINLDIKRNNQKTPPGDSTSWHLGHQASPAKKVGSLVATNSKPFSPNRESDPHIGKFGESSELSQQGCSVHRPTGPEEASHHNPLIMRRRVRSFISPIPSKRQFTDDKGKSVSSASKHGADKIPAVHVVSPVDADAAFSAMTEESVKSVSDERCPTVVSLSSPTKTKILPPRKGRGLKLEAIVQKITSPNIRRITIPCTSESSTEPVTLDEILSLKCKGPGEGSGSMQEVTERTINLASIPCNDEIKVKGLSPKSIDTWTSHDDKQIKKEIDEQSCENQELLQSSSIIQSSSNHILNARGDSPEFETKCPLQTVQPLELGDKDKLTGGPCSVTPKQDIVIPPKGYFPSGKKKGRPVGSVNKQKKQQLQEQPQAQLPVTGGLTPLLAPPPPPMLPVSKHGFESDLKPKRRCRERRKAAGTSRRRGRQNTPAVAPLEPEIKLKYASQSIDKTETKAKSFFPYIHVENKEELGLSCVIINAEDEEQRWKKLTSVRKGQRSTSPQPTESKALPVSSFMVQGPVVTESTSIGHLVCCFCRKWANYKNLGDVFGPFYTQEYASTLSKNPPPKKTIDTPKKVKVRHKDASDGSKTDSDEEDEPQLAREQRSLPAHPRFKRRNRSGDCASSRHAVPSRRKTTDSCELNSLDSSGTSTADGTSDQGFQIPQLPLDSNEFWMHEGCVLWANGVYLVCGRLYGLQEALDTAREMNCAHCQEPGATLGCYNKGCVCCYHFPCAMDSECLLSEENFSVRCPKHKMKTLKGLSAEQLEQS